MSVPWFGWWAVGGRVLRFLGRGELGDRSPETWVASFGVGRRWARAPGLGSDAAAPLPLPRRLSPSPHAAAAAGLASAHARVGPLPSNRLRLTAFRSIKSYQEPPPSLIYFFCRKATLARHALPPNAPPIALRCILWSEL